jgi:gliding motility-associated-like protein
MTGRKLGHSKRQIFILLILLSFSGVLIAFQPIINGVINKYGRVTGIGLDYVIVSNPAQLAQFSDGIATGKGGDTVLVIQMKGAQIIVPENNFFGSLQTAAGSPGKYEFLIIKTINTGSGKITFRNNINNSYDISGDVQIIKTPSFNSVQVKNGDLICAPWDSISKTGGVLTLIVGSKITLNANIDVHGKGFLGGGAVSGDGKCVNSNPARFDKFFFPKDSTNSGFKGESPVSKGWIDLSTQIPIFPSYSKGKGANFTGGGGGNGNLSGGGGGANYGQGGKGGRENSTCLPLYLPIDGGSWGNKIKFTLLDGGIFLGGGGGGSTVTTGTASPGANGGGIIIIVCDTIIGNNHLITSDGGSASAAVGNAGAGGGGGGGSVALYLSSFSTSSITVSAKGGNGGNNPGTFGEGGGGGGGLIWINNITIPGSVLRKPDGGSVGSRTGGPTGTNGALGESLTTFVPLLNGFLFNSIQSSGSNDETDTICSDVIPKPILGTTPVGGSGSYTYLWQKKNDSGGAPVNIPSSNTQNHSFSIPEPDTFFIRRVIKDDVTLLNDTSKWVKIVVQPAITGNLIGKDTTICYGQDPLKLIPLNSGPSKGNGIYKYRWIQNLTNTNWASSPDATGTLNTNPDYDPPKLFDTTYYQRIVTSGRCINYSSTVTITVLPKITGNIPLSADTVICEGSKFNSLRVTLPGGGDTGNYKYQWQDSVTSSIKYLPAAGTNTGTGYLPDTSTFSVIEHRFLRRVVYSGPDSVCQDRSIPIQLTRFHKIKNNIISPAVQTIGHDSLPVPLTGAGPAPGNGDGTTYNYVWWSKTNTLPWDTAVSGYTVQNYIPGTLTDSTWYRRTVKSSVCRDTSNIVVVNVHKTINNNIVFISTLPVPNEDTICSGTAPLKLRGRNPGGGTLLANDYAFQWKSSTSLASGYTDIAGATDSVYQPGPLTQTTYFRRYVSSPKIPPATSVSQSNYIKITVLPKITNFGIDKDQSVCKGSPLPALKSTTPGPANGDNTFRFTWRQDSANTGWTNIPGYVKTSSSTYAKSKISDPFKFRRYIYSGSNDCCADSSNIVAISINPLPAGAITRTTDTTVCTGTTTKVPLKIHLAGAANWRMVYSENGTQNIIPKMTSDTIIYINRTPSLSSQSYLFKIDSVRDANACKADPLLLTTSRKIDFYQMPVAQAGADKAFCGPVAQLAAVNSVLNSAGLWTKVSGPGPILFSDITRTNASATADPADPAWGLKNNYRLLWRETNGICFDTNSVVITMDQITSPPKAGKDTTIWSLTKRYILHAVKPVIGTGKWYTDTGVETDSIVKLSLGTNLFEWRVVNGACDTSDFVTINAKELQIPEGFSPNSDGVNDEFEIKGLDTGNDEITLRILNSAGTEVYFTSNANNGTYVSWKGGNSKGIELPEGTYYYTVTIRSKLSGDSTSQVQSGFVVLKRINIQ